MADESVNYGQVAGYGGDRLPFPVGEKRAAADYPEIDKLVGMEVEGELGFAFRLVRLNVAAGLTAANAECRAFCYSSETDGATRTFDVETALLGATLPLNRVIGFGVPEQVALSDNDLFWVVIDGPYIWATLGDDTADVAVGEYVQIDDDADEGKLKSTDTTFSAEFTLGVSLDVADTDGDQFRFKPIHRMRA